MHTQQTALRTDSDSMRVPIPTSHQSYLAAASVPTPPHSLALALFLTHCNCDLLTVLTLRERDNTKFISIVCTFNIEH